MIVKNPLKRILAVVSAAAVITGTSLVSDDWGIKVNAAMNTSEFSAGYTYSTEMRGLTALQLTSDMGIGWNLGNSLESANNETEWGNPVTTKSMIDAIAAKGFTTLRVPVRWDDHYTDSNYTISSDFMDRVETVVNYGLANDMYVILNVHHNDIQTMVSTNSSTQANVKNELSTIWTQIGNRFKNYGDKLIFETINEPRENEDWGGSSSLYSCVNAYNETARSAIRATGGNNAKRLVMMPTYCASGDEAKLAGWTKSASDNMVAVSIHAYLPFDFAFTGSGHTDWRASDLSELKGFFSRLNTHFISTGIPVVIGEFGATNKGNTSEREKYADIYPSLARQFAQQDIPCIWWDNNATSVGSENFGIFDRNTKSFNFDSIATALVNAYNGNPDYETEVSGEEILFSGTASSSNYGQATTIPVSAVTDLKAGEEISCNYSSSNSPELILQSMTVGYESKSWVKVNPDSASNGVAKWSYSTLLNAFGGSYAGLDKVYIGDTGASLTVTKIYIARGTGHTHVYNGQTQVTLQPSATTNGRQVVHCSVSGCTATRVLLVSASSAGTQAKPKITSAVPGNECVTLTWDAVEGASNYAVYTKQNGVWKLMGTRTATGMYVKGLTNGVTYGFAVKAYVNGAWTSVSSSDIVNATPVAPAVQKPVITRAVPGNSLVELNWTAVEGATNYAVYTKQNGVWKLMGTRTAIGMYVKGLTNGVTYGLAVKAYVNGAWSSVSSSDIKYATPVAPATAKPVITKAVPGDSLVALNWTTVEGATNYAVYTKQNGVWKLMGTRTATGMYVRSLTNGVTYGLAVKAYVNGAWTSVSSSDIVNVTPQA